MENVTPEATNQDGQASERSAMSGDGEKAEEDRRSLPSSGGRRKQGR
jgi:hypothetical protein